MLGTLKSNQCRWLHLPAESAVGNKIMKITDSIPYVKVNASNPLYVCGILKYPYKMNRMKREVLQWLMYAPHTREVLCITFQILYVICFANYSRNIIRYAVPRVKFAIQQFRVRKKKLIGQPTSNNYSPVLSQKFKFITVPHWSYNFAIICKCRFVHTSRMMFRRKQIK
jgi:hypothetical protein